jgi:tetratricopeptide (TPR) repeat protein
MFDPGLLLAGGHEARRERRFEDARDLFAQAVAESRYTLDRSVLAQALKALGQAERDLRHPSTALKCYREAAEMGRVLGDELALAHTIRHIADIQREQKLFTAAAASYNEALALYGKHAAAPPLDRANALRGIALLRDQTGDSHEALLMWRGAKTLYENAAVPAGVAECEAHIAFLLGV